MLARPLAGWLIAAILSGCVDPAPPPIPDVQTGEFGPAVEVQISEALERARLSPDEAAPTGELGKVLLAYDQFDTAAQCFERARRLEATEPRWLYYLAYAQERGGQAVEALDSYRAFLQNSPRSRAAQLRLANLLLESGNAVEAARLFEQLRAEGATEPDVEFGLGKSHRALGDPEKAVASFQKVLAVESAYGAVHYALALAYRDLAEAAESERHLVLYRQHQGKRPAIQDPWLQEVETLRIGASSLSVKARELVAAGQLRLAAETFEEAIAADSSYLPAHVALIYVYWQLGENQKGEERFRSAVALDENSATAHLNYGLLLGASQRREEAERHFRRAVEIEPANADAQTFLGFALEELGRFAQAERQYEEALRREPNQPRANFLLGRRRLVRGDASLASRYFERALAGPAPGSTWFLHQIGLAYLTAGDRPTARDYFERARTAAIRFNQANLLTQIERDASRAQSEKTSQ